MDLSPSGVLELARSPHGKKMIRYTLVSVVSVIVSQVVLTIAFGGFHWTARSANILACTVATVPSYELNRKWAWGKHGKSHFWKEVAPFWALAFIGLAFSTWSADFADTYVKDHGYSHPVQTVVVALAALAAFGVLWVAKFIIFNQILFKTDPQLEQDGEALEGASGVPT